MKLLIALPGGFHEHNQAVNEHKGTLAALAALKHQLRFPQASETVLISPF